LLQTDFIMMMMIMIAVTVVTSPNET